MMDTQEQETTELLEKFALFLIFIENQTGAIIHTRELKGDDLLDVDSYLPEIEQVTEIRLDSAESIATGLGQYNVSIIIGTYTWESKDYFLSE